MSIIPQNEGPGKNETEAAAKALVAAACQTNPISAFFWALYSEHQNAKWKYRVEEFMSYAASIDRFLELIEDEQFQDGLALSFNKFAKQRLEEKRVVIKKILLGFAYNEEKDKFQLERFYDVLDKISLELLRHLLFIKNVIIPKGKKDYEKYKDGYSDYGEFKGYHAITGLRVLLETEENPFYYDKKHVGIDVLNPDIYSEAKNLGIFHVCQKDYAYYKFSEDYYLSSFGFDFLEYIDNEFHS